MRTQIWIAVSVYVLIKKRLKLDASLSTILQTLSVKKWLHNFGRCDEWNLCLTAGTVVPANQERR